MSSGPRNLLVLSTFYLLVSIPTILLDYDSCFSTDYGVLGFCLSLLYSTILLRSSFFFLQGIKEFFILFGTGSPMFMRCFPRFY